MNEWYNTTEIAGLELPGLPATKRGIDKLAKRQGWNGRIRKASGGGLEYHYTALPPAAQAALLAREAPPPSDVPIPAPTPPKPKELDPVVKADGDAAAALLAGKARDRLNAKLAVLDVFQGLTGQALMAAVVRYNSGELNVTDDSRAIVPSVSMASIHRWRDQVRRLGLARVAGKFGNRKGCGVIDSQPEIAAALRGLIVETPHVRPGFASEWLAARYDDQKQPGRMTVRRWMARWKRENEELYCRLRDPDSWKSRYMLGWGDASAGILRLNQEWQADSTPADLMLSDGRRHSLLFLIDVWSRRLKIRASRTSKSAAVASLLRHGILDWGMPEKLKTDNGQDYLADHINRICFALDIERELCDPFSPWQKPHVERVIGTFVRDLVEMLPGYIGHNVGEREQLRARQQFKDRLFVKDSTVEIGLTPDQLQDFCDRWCAAYHTRIHGGHDMDGLSPLLKAAGWREPIRAITNERALDLLLAPAPSKDGWRVVSKDDGVPVDGYHYLAPELGRYARQRVRVLYDPEGDLGQVWCFDDRGAFIAIAQCPELRGLDRQALAARAKALQQEHIQAAAKAARLEAKSLNLKTAVEEVQAARDAAVAALVAFPSPAVVHVTPHIAGAEAALCGQSALSGGEITPEMLKAAGYTPADRAESAPAAEVIPLRSDGWLGNLRDLCARTLGRDVAPTDADADYLATYYGETRNPRIFEGEMTEKYGYARFHAWKKAVLDQAQATATRLQPMAG